MGGQTGTLCNSTHTDCDTKPKGQKAPAPTLQSMVGRDERPLVRTALCSARRSRGANTLTSLPLVPSRGPAQRRVLTRWALCDIVRRKQTRSPSYPHTPSVCSLCVKDLCVVCFILGTLGYENAIGLSESNGVFFLRERFCFEMRV